MSTCHAITAAGGWIGPLRADRTDDVATAAPEALDPALRQIRVCWQAVQYAMVVPVKDT